MTFGSGLQIYLRERRVNCTLNIIIEHVIRRKSINIET